MARIYTPTTTLTTSPTGQLRLIQNAFNEIKCGTVKEITDHVVKNQMVTKQDPFRVVMFYMIYLKKQGKIKEITEQESKDLRTPPPAPIPTKTTAKSSKSSPKTTRR